MIRKKEIFKFKFRLCAIFPRSSPRSIFAAITFHTHVRNGMRWFHNAIKTEIKKLNASKKVFLDV